MAKLTSPLIVYLPDTRGVEISPFGKGNLKIGPGVFTYSRLAGKYTLLGTCPGSTPECEDICYAKRITGIVRQQYKANSESAFVPELPQDARLVRIHVSGDFDAPDYINNWCQRLQERPDVTAWAYTRSWRVKALLPALERLRAMPNVQLFASMDVSTEELPPAGWRIAWIEGDTRVIGDGENRWAVETALGMPIWNPTTARWPVKGHPAYVCPEQTQRKVNCAECRYCFDGKRHDVIFLKH
jgi:hypothetical protein